MSAPNLTVQTASLYASGDTSTFTGTGGPAGFSPFLGEFSNVVSSVGIASEPFDDEVYSVDAGDQVTFVVAIQNFGSVPAYNVKLRDTIPLGFSVDLSDLTVTDGAGNDLSFSGDPFSPTDGLTLASPLAAYNGTSGANVVLLLFTATATNSLTLPGATLSNAAQIVSYASSANGPNLATNSPTALTASTPLQTSPLLVSSAADQAAGTLTAGHTASFDITVTLPEGSVGDLRIDESLPQIGSSWLQLVSAQVVSLGSHLTPSAPVVVASNGSVSFGTVVNAADNLVTADDNIVLRVFVRGGGTTAGSGSITTTVSAADPSGNGARLSQSVTNTLSLGQPDMPPTLTGISAAQYATASTPVFPFGSVVAADADVAQIQTLTIHLSDRSLGTLSGAAGLTTNSAGDYVLTCTAALVSSLLPTLVFTPAAPGTESFGLTLDDGAGGIATAQVGLTVAASTHPSSLTQFPISSSTVLTSTATGSSTYQQTQIYAGAISNVSSQFLYDGDAPLAIVANQDGMLISSQAPQTAVQVHGGTNVVEVAAGSGFLTSGSGADTFLLHADQAQTTWSTIVNFHPGDQVILYGFNAGTSQRSWSASAGAAGYTGATLRFDIDDNGTTDSSLTFAGKTIADTTHYVFGSGVVGNSPYLSITAA